MFVNIYTHVFGTIDPICTISLITVGRLRFHCCLQVRSGVDLASKLFSIFQWNCSISMYFLAICRLPPHLVVLLRMHLL